MSNLILYKAHELAVSRYSLTEQESKLITYCVSRINPTLEGSKEERTIHVPYDEYATIMGMDKQLAKKNLNNSVKELIKRVVEVQHKDGTYSKEMFHWVNVARFNKSTQSVELTFSEEIQPYLFQLKSFIKYRLDHVKLFQNRHSIRVYEWLLSETKSHKEKSIRISLVDFKYMLMMENKYQLFKKFNHEVLKKIVDDINTYSDLNLTLKTQGRPVHTLIWEVSHDPSKYNLARTFDSSEQIFEAEYSNLEVDIPELPEENRSLSDWVKFFQENNEYLDPNADISQQTTTLKIVKKYARTYKLLRVLLNQHTSGGIALSESEHKFIQSMIKHYESKKSYDTITVKQNDFLAGIIAKYRPEL